MTIESSSPQTVIVFITFHHRYIVPVLELCVSGYWYFLKASLGGSNAQPQLISIDNLSLGRTLLNGVEHLLELYFEGIGAVKDGVGHIYLAMESPVSLVFPFTFCLK